MPQLNSTELTRLVDQGEQLVSSENPFLKDRYSPAVTAGTASILLPTYIVSITRATWLGMKMDPMPNRTQRTAFQSLNQIGKPYWYVYDNVGLSRVSLYPVPNQNLAAGTNLWTTGIPTSCIFEFWRISDNSTFVIPAFFKRQLLRYYLASKSAQKEGRIGKFSASKYYNDRFRFELARFVELQKSLNTEPRLMVVNQSYRGRPYPARPVLPIDRFGVYTDDF